jgi:DMSO/TMAO reductase YedYZ molybdopterin-dependent catalytic subunit
MNGETLPAAHGFPLRAIVGGWYGMASVKWLTRIIVVDKPFGGWWQTIDYSCFKREDGLPQLAAITRMEPKAEIARPTFQEIVAIHKPYRVFGAAWAGESAVAKVEFSADNGAAWKPVNWIAKPAPLTWALWEHAWTPDRPGRARLMVRATDEQGRTQPTQRDPDRRTYMINHITPMDVIVA